MFANPTIHFLVCKYLVAMVMYSTLHPVSHPYSEQFAVTCEHCIRFHSSSAHVTLKPPSWTPRMVLYQLPLNLPISCCWPANFGNNIIVLNFPFSSQIALKHVFSNHNSFTMIVLHCLHFRQFITTNLGLVYHYPNGYLKIHTLETALYNRFTIPSNYIQIRVACNCNPISKILTSWMYSGIHVARQLSFLDMPSYRDFSYNHYYYPVHISQRQSKSMEPFSSHISRAAMQKVLRYFVL